jgi:hypothetical protein
MAFNYSFSVCTTDLFRADRFVAEWVGATRPESVTSVQATATQQTTIYSLGFRLTDRNGLKANRRAHYSLDGKLYFSVSGYDYRALAFPLQYSISYGTEELIKGTITDNCGSNDGSQGGSPGNTGGSHPSPLPDPPSVPPTPCLPPQPAPVSTPPVPTPCGGSYGPSGNASGFGTR